ncbi:hypothetical protein BC835DRAFT_1268955 [Cytidiella melzeri]|nr:hypothetical protein BC835DRAFT_1268955 [Cytidiella melzeri]
MDSLLPLDRSGGWRVDMSEQWDVLGPFPIHAREQHFLSPSFPLNLSGPIDLDAKWPSAYADGGEVGWGSTHSQNGTLRLSYPEIRWASLRATEGWAALQHHSVLRTSITVYPPTSTKDCSEQPPQLLLDVQQGAFFALRPSESSDHALEEFVPSWYAGNIYAMGAAPPHSLLLPTKPSATEATVYELFVSSDYEIRLFGDPTVSGSDVPVLSIAVHVQVEEFHPTVVTAGTHNVIPDFVEGWAFGDALGVGIRSSGDWWTVEDFVFANLALTIRLSEKTRIAPGQTTVIPLTIIQHDAFIEDSIELEFHLKSSSGAETTVATSLDLKHLTNWDSTSYSPIVSTHLSPHLTPTAFLSIPPKVTGTHGTKTPLLFLHGAGVDVLTSHSIGCAPPRQSQSWVIMPTGRTAWGLDWHGPSTEDAWTSFTALYAILNRNPRLSSWVFHSESRVVLLGHSNGGQGTWNVAARYPDAVLAAIPAAAYIKSQAYISLVQSRSAHFIDPLLRAILETSLTPDDNDLFISNLVDTPILAIHGGADENVPVWHTRALVNTLQTWNPEANIMFKEDPGEPHCYQTVFENNEVQAFIDQSIEQEDFLTDRTPHVFTLTVAIPSESGSLHGFRVLKLKTPGRLARLAVTTDNEGVHVVPKNVATFSLSIRGLRSLRTRNLLIDSQPFEVNEEDDIYVFNQEVNGAWKVASHSKLQIIHNVPIQPSGRMSKILSSNGPIMLVIPHKSEQHVNTAVRLAHDLDVYHKLFAEIMDAPEALTRLDSGSLGEANIVVIGGPENSFTRRILHESPTPFKLVEDSLTLRDRPLAKGTSSAFLHPHPASKSSLSLVLVLYSTDDEGMERLLRLFPIRTGVPVPDWIVLGQSADWVGAAGVEGAGVWGDRWSWNEGLSFF